MMKFVLFGGVISIGSIITILNIEKVTVNVGVTPQGTSMSSPSGNPQRAPTTAVDERVSKDGVSCPGYHNACVVEMFSRYLIRNTKTGMFGVFTNCRKTSTYEAICRQSSSGEGSVNYVEAIFAHHENGFFKGFKVQDHRRSPNGVTCHESVNMCVVQDHVNYLIKNKKTQQFDMFSNCRKLDNNSSSCQNRSGFTFIFEHNQEGKLINAHARGRNP